MFVIELEAGGAEERPRLERDHAVIHRSTADAVEALDHLGDLRRAHFRPELRHLLVLGLTLANEVMPAVQSADEADAVEQRSVEGPVLDGADVLEELRPVAVPRPGRGDDQASIADADVADANERIVAEAITFAAAETRAGGETGNERNEGKDTLHEIASSADRRADPCRIGRVRFHLQVAGEG